MTAPNTYVPYHMHSMLSNGTTNIDSITDFHAYVDEAKKCGIKAMGFSEHGNIFAWLKKKEYIEKSGMKYLHCVEAYLTEDNEERCAKYTATDLLQSEIAGRNISFQFKKRRRNGDDKWIATAENHSISELIGKEIWYDPDTVKTEYTKTRDNYHCVLIAKNYAGVKEINKLVSRSFCRDDFHFYYMPRISFEELFSTSDNIIVTTACLGGVLNNGSPIAKERFLGFLIRNKHRCYLEIQHHNTLDQIEYNQMLYQINLDTGIPLIAGTDTHAINEEQMDGRAILQKAKNVHFADEDALDLIFKTPEQLVRAYKKQGSLPMEVVYEAINNTILMAETVDEFKLDYSPKYPKLYEDSEAAFKKKINEGVVWRGITKLPNYKKYLDRIYYEYDTYKHNNAIDFMLLEEDYKSEMRRRNVKFGYSRGSVSGSIIAYLLGITEIDSVKYNLNFERFMNKERVSLADIDTDWLSEDRKVVKDYLYSKEGLYCCDIVTFNTIAMKGAIRDVCRGLYSDEMDSLPKDLKKRLDDFYQMAAANNGPGFIQEMPKELKSEIEKYAKNYLKLSDEICDQLEKDGTKDIATPELKRRYPEVFKYVDLVNGVVVSVGNHPAGCVVSPVPVDEWFGTFTTTTDEYPISVLNMKEIDSLNFVKLDILGLDNIGLIYKTCDLAGIPFLTPDNTPADDLDVWNSIRDDTTMIFQWESESATAYLKQLFSDKTVARIREKNPEFSYMDLLSIGNGAIRPAGESYRDNLAKGIYQSYGNEALDEFMKPTLGYLVYQEGVIEFLHSFCGYSMGEADIVRRCIDENSLILMSNGKTKRIREINEGDRVLSVNNDGVIKADTVNKVFQNGEQECYRIIAKHNYELIATKNHKILTQRGWCRVSDLTSDDFIMTPRIIYCDKDGLLPSQRLSIKEMFLIGILLGDGTLGDNSVRFTNSDMELIEAYKDCVCSRTRGKKKKVQFSMYAQDGISVNKIYSIETSSEPHRSSLRNLFKKYKLNVKSAQKHIPDEIMLYPPSEKIQSLLGGLFSTDGGYVEKSQSIEYYSISEQLAHDIKHLLLKFGIYSYVHSGYVKGYDYNCYKVRISQKDSLKSFEEYVLPYVVGLKRDDYLRIINGNRNNPLAYNYMLPKECKDEIWCMSEKTRVSLNSLIKTDELDGRNNVGIHRGEFGLTDTKAKKIINNIFCPYTYELLLKKYIPIRIKSIEPCGVRTVYDLEVADDHNYIANDIIVHNCFAKKIGTQAHLPKIRDGFKKTMEEKFGVNQDESDKLIASFIKVIEDASSYLFSKNHADPYSWIGYICGYLRHYYPLEFITTALNIFEGKENKSLAIIDYAKKCGIKISPIKFRHSIAQYNFDKDSNTIFKGISSIKYMNSTVADEIYELRSNRYNTFIDLLYDLSEKTSINSRQLKILIELDFFEEFGDASHLLKQYELFESLSDKCQLKKTKLEELGLSEDEVRPYASKETEKMFTKVNMRELLVSIAPGLPYRKRTLKEKIQAQIEHLGYVDISGEEYAGMAAVLEVDTKYSPKLKMHSLKNGTTVECKISKQDFKKCRLEAGDLVRITKQTRKAKQRRNDSGEYETIPGVYELWISGYKKIDSI